ncbi:MAG TPA: GTP-binding protein [Dissulfurispiraceae bacterium]
MKITVVCGLLGAGKTTFIRHYLEGTGEKTVVLVNDFGRAGIDGEIVSSGGIESIELPSGCVCCTLKFDLITTIQKVIREFAPSHLMIEPSGIAAVSGVLEALETLELKQAAVVGLVDVTEFAELYESGMYGRFFEDQIANSDIILINKIDLADGEMIARTAAVIERLNPVALVFRTVNAGVDGPLPDVQRDALVRTAPGSHLRFDTLSLFLKDPMNMAAIRKFFSDMGEGVYGNVVRAKALVQTGDGPFRFDLSYGKIDCTPFGAPVAKGRLVMIGEGLKKAAAAKYLEVPALSR